MTYTAEDTLQYVEKHSTVKKGFLYWLKRSKQEVKRARFSYSLHEVSDFLHTPFEELQFLVKKSKLQVKNNRLTSNQVAKVKKRMEDK